MRYVSVAESVEHNFDPAGYSQFVENAEQIVFDGVFGQLETLSDLAIGKAFGHATHHIGFAHGKQPTVYVQTAREPGLSQSLEDVLQFGAAGPNLTVVHTLDALGQQAKRFGAAENALGPGSKCL